MELNNTSIWIERKLVLSFVMLSNMMEMKYNSLLKLKWERGSIVDAKSMRRLLPEYFYFRGWGDSLHPLVWIVLLYMIVGFFKLLT